MINTQLELHVKTPYDIEKEYNESVLKGFYIIKRLWISIQNMGKRFNRKG
jgi:hypothetical protein